MWKTGRVAFTGSSTCTKVLIFLVIGLIFDESAFFCPKYLLCDVVRHHLEYFHEKVGNACVIQ